MIATYFLVGDFAVERPTSKKTNAIVTLKAPEVYEAADILWDFEDGLLPPDTTPNTSGANPVVEVIEEAAYQGDYGLHCHAEDAGNAYLSYGDPDNYLMKKFDFGMWFRLNVVDADCYPTILQLNCNVPLLDMYYSLGLGWVLRFYSDMGNGQINLGDIPTCEWRKRIKLTIDHTKVDAALADFPVLVYLSASSGITDADVTAVFDELGSDANRKRIAVTLDDEVTQCYVEIDKWDDANEQAWLWVKVPNVSHVADTVLYLWYDSTHPDNVGYVGDTGDAAAENVWEDSAVMVQHMRGQSRQCSHNGFNAIR